MHTLAGLLAILVAHPTPSPAPDATPTRRGVVNTTTQSLGGLKTFVDGGVQVERLTVLSSSSDAGFGPQTGVLVQGPSHWVISGITFDTVTTAIAAVRGATVDLLGSTPTFTGVTNELSLDGVFSTFADLAALPAPQAISNAYGTKIIR